MDYLNKYTFSGKENKTKHGDQNPVKAGLPFKRLFVLLFFSLCVLAVFKFILTPYVFSQFSNESVYIVGGGVEC